MGNQPRELTWMGTNAKPSPFNSLYTSTPVRILQFYRRELEELRLWVLCWS